jgi:cytochrome bd-type quinol oxidase subunit 1
MHDLPAARPQMDMSLAFHIVFACGGVVIPLLIAIAEWHYLKTSDDDVAKVIGLDLERLWVAPYRRTV